MPTYHLEHHASEDLLVYQASSLLLTAKRRRGWDGVLRSEYFLHDRRILAASLSEIFWSWRLKITFADPEFPITPLSSSQFKTPHGVVTINRQVLKNPVRTFLLNSQPVGTASMNMHKFFAPFEYTVELQGPPELDIFVLLAMMLSESDMVG